MARSRTGLIVFLFVLLAAGLVLSRLDLSATRHALAGASWRWVAAGALVNLLSIGVDAARWRAIIGGVRHISLVATIEGLLIGWVSNVVLPFKLGEGAKAWVLAQRTGLPLATVVSTVVVDKTIDAMSLVVFVVLASSVAPLPPAVREVRTWGLVGLVVIAVLYLAGRAWVRARRLRLAGAPFAEGRLGRALAGFAILGHQHRLPGIIGLAVLAWFARMWVVWCLLRAFHLDLPAVASASVLAVINVGTAAVAAPGNIGVFELSAMAALGMWGVAGETALSFGLALHAAEVVPTVAVGLIVQAVAGPPMQVVVHEAPRDGEL